MRAKTKLIRVDNRLVHGKNWGNLIQCVKHRYNCSGR